MKVLELKMYATKWPYIEFTSCIPFLKMESDYRLLQSFYDYAHTDAQKNPDLVVDNKKKTLTVLSKWQAYIFVCLWFSRPNQPLQSTTNRPVMTLLNQF